MRKALFPKLAITALVGALASVLAISASQGTAVANINEIDTDDREEVATSYLAAVAGAQNVQHEWSGSTETCNAGQVSPEFHAATLGAANWFREMAGLEHVVDNADANKRAQAAAIMMHAQNSLSHFPSSSWACFTEAGATSAGKANLTLGLVGVEGVAGQIEDAGAQNLALGHRRWLLFPPLDQVGIGSTSRAGVVEVIGNFGAGQSDSPWVGWPPPGFVPHDVVYDRWSISRPGADFSRAAVSVTRNGSPVPVTLLPIADGFGDPTLGWEVPGVGQTTSDVTYQVTVSNVTIGNNTQEFSYSVTAFDPSDTPVATCGGQPATIFGTNGADVIVGTPGVDVIVAFDGRDQISGLGGNDIICGGNGRDSVNGGAGADVIYGNAGDDTLKGNAGADIIVGGKGSDLVSGGKGSDDLTGNSGNDTLVGGTGSDICRNHPNQNASATAESRKGCESVR